MQSLIDFNALAAGHDYFEPGDYDHSPDHRYVAWSADTQGSERYQLQIRDVSTGIDQDLINDTYSMAWANERVLFYTRVDDDLRPSQVYRHEVGTPASDDVLVFEEADKRFFCSVWLSASEQYVFIGSDMNDESEVWYIPVVDVFAKPLIIQPREAGIEYSVEHQAERFLILTNADNAHDFKIVTAPCHAPQRGNWKDWLAYQLASWYWIFTSVRTGLCGLSVKMLCRAFAIVRHQRLLNLPLLLPSNRKPMHSALSRWLNTPQIYFASVISRLQHPNRPLHLICKVVSERC